MFIDENIFLSSQTGEGPTIRSRADQKKIHIFFLWIQIFTGLIVENPNHFKDTSFSDIKSCGDFTVR